MRRRRFIFACLIIGYAIALQIGVSTPLLLWASDGWAKNDNGNGGGGKGGGNGGNHGGGNAGGNSGGNSGGNGNAGGNAGGNSSGNANANANANTNNSTNGKGKNTNATGSTAAVTTDVQAGNPSQNAANHGAERVISHEIVVANATGNLAQYASSNGFTVLSQTKLGALGISVARLSTPANLSLATARAHLQTAFPEASIDYNHVYTPQVSMTLPAPGYAQKEIRWDIAGKGCGTSDLKLGMLDTLANVDDPLLAGARIEQQYFLDGADAIAAGIEHGSIVAALLAGQKDFGLLPHAALSIAGIFTLDEEGQPIASATSFVAGLDWLASQGIKTINTSLSGPHDGLMEMAIGAALKHDIAIVAAAGNDGLSDVPQFPAAYSGVIGVTAIDADRKPFTRANTGSFVTFAAPGVDLWIPVSNASAGTSGQAKGEIVAGNYVSGTSFAAPFVAAALAASGNNADNLASAAIDLGPKGRDPVFGYGLVQAPMNCATANN